MKRDDRQQAIMDLLVAEGEVELDSLAERFAVSKMTIHRDLDELEGEGLLRKIRGGATIQSGTRFESDFRFRERQGAAEKTAMANAALALIEPGMTVMINDGSLAAILGKACTAKRPLTVITNNCAVIDALKTEAGITLLALGGLYSSKFNAYLGKVTEDALSRLHADIAFISTPAVSGTKVYHMDDDVLRSKRAMMDQAQVTCLLVNHARFGKAALHHLADLSEFDHIITDATPAPVAKAALDAAGITLTITKSHETHT
ncbi:DeoR/GlpR family DNA-binding transcription regulator [Rhodovulum sp. FJ3]|uniref:DeoR/GlpR family DNA-binding transcription regulator n=1 Tax=Rhodovulum sp. FJ3 TaxID=3079053 RepID=UPI00293DCE6F|nr:DeoR/GlpR family DNA-binding transcription regulator [Rhodovulum sp. FJ3]MDV4169362.1 DeoR/GlpR family DNA-binding transcription regulator [Rhodovulum sp. FJ3]